MYEQSLWWIAIKFVLSIAFPLTVTLLYWKAAREDIGITLGWWMFVFGAAQMYLFAESGVAFHDGNFWWSAQIALFLLFVWSTLFWIKQIKPEMRAYISTAVFALHLISGIVLIAAMLSTVTEINIW